jgi:hypothetical protein
MHFGVVATTVKDINLLASLLTTEAVAVDERLCNSYGKCINITKKNARLQYLLCHSPPQNVMYIFLHLQKKSL